MIIPFFCAGLVGVIVLGSWIVEMIENCRKDSWRKRITADDIEALGRLFDSEK